MPNTRLRMIGPVWAGAGVVPLFIWWLGWTPGFASSETIEQWDQVLHGPISNESAIHTIFLDVFSRGGRYPELVTLVQVLLFGVLLVYGARVLVRAAVPAWVAVGAAWLLGLSPAIAPTTLALWQDVPFGLAFLWAWIELLGMVVDPLPPSHYVRTTGGERMRPREWDRATRLGLALAAVWVFRGSGPITVILLLAALLVWMLRRDWRTLVVIAVTMAGVILIVTGALYAAADVLPDPTVPAEVFLPNVAASYNAEPETFTTAELDMLDDVAPLGVWTGRYDCDESTRLLFDPAFDRRPVRQQPIDWLRLERSVLLRDPDSVIEHRACAASYLYLPWAPENTHLHTLPYAIPTNDLGLVREPISDVAFAVTDWYWNWAEDYSWLTWRPAMVIWSALAAIVVFAFRARRFLVPSALFLAHLANVTLTSPAQEFRNAYPLYLVAVLTITLLWPALRLQGKHVPPPGGTSRQPMTS